MQLYSYKPCYRVENIIYFQICSGSSLVTRLLEVYIYRGENLLLFKLKYIARDFRLYRSPLILFHQTSPKDMFAIREIEGLESYHYLIFNSKD